MAGFIGSFTNSLLSELSASNLEKFNKLNERMLAYNANSVFAHNNQQIILFGSIYNINTIAKENGITNFISDAQLFFELFEKGVNLIKKLDGEFTAIVYYNEISTLI